MAQASTWRSVRQRFPRAAALLVAVLLSAGLSAAQSPPASTGGLRERLQNEVARLAATAGGKVGVSALHLESGQSVSWSGEEPFPMASAYKVPIAVQWLRLVDQGQASLDQMVTLRQSDLHPGSGILSDMLDDPGVALSTRNLLELMLLISDNSATDLLLRAAGGPQAVTSRVRELGLEGLRVDRPTLNLIADWAGVTNLPSEEELSPGVIRKLMEEYEARPEEERRRAAGAFDADPRDTSTPEDMVRLLEKLWRGELLSQESTALLLDIMTRCQTGENRIKGLLPPGTVVAHKTGTIGGTTNDVGIITLPDGAGHVAVAVFVKESTREVPERERAIAQIARALYDYFLFSPGEAKAVVAEAGQGNRGGADLQSPQPANGIH